MTASLPIDAFALKEKVASLEASLLSAHPSMGTLLRDIHQALRKQPENVTLMTEEEIAIIVRGLERQTQTYLADTTTKGAKKSAVVGKIKALGSDAF